MDRPITHSLIERLEKLQGPDREVGNEILLACGWKTIKTNQSDGTGSPNSVWWCNPYREYFSDSCQPDPTSSIDAALTLIPQDFYWKLKCSDHHRGYFSELWAPDKKTVAAIGDGATPAIALCIASLRARAALADKERGMSDGGKDALRSRWSVERHDNDDGSIAYEIWTNRMGHLIARIIDYDNRFAKRDAEHIVALHNGSLGPMGF